MTGDESITDGTPKALSMRKMKLRFAGSCSGCGLALSAGAPAMYDRLLKSVCCLPCADGVPPVNPLPASTETEILEKAMVPGAGTAGASALREFERRRLRRETGIHEAHPRLGKLILALSEEPTSTRVWQTGAVGEQQLGRALDALTGAGVLLLHDRRIPGSRANIDHIAVGPAGVFVIDAKRYRGKRPERRVEGRLFRPRVEKLFVGGRDRSALLDGIGKQVDLVDGALRNRDLDGVVARGVLYFLDSDWPLMGGSFRVRGFDVLWPRLLQKMVGSAGPLDPDGVRTLRRLLATTFPSA